MKHRLTGPLAYQQLFLFNYQLATNSTYRRIYLVVLVLIHIATEPQVPLAIVSATVALLERSFE